MIGKQLEYENTEVNRTLYIGCLKDFASS